MFKIGWWLTKKGLKTLWLSISLGLWIGGCDSGKTGLSFWGFILFLLFIFVGIKKIRKWWWKKAKDAIQKRAETEKKPEKKVGEYHPEKEKDFNP